MVIKGGPDNNCLKEANAFFNGVDIGNVLVEIKSEFITITIIVNLEFT